MSTKTLLEVSKALNLKLIGDPHCSISRVAPLDRAVAGDLSFLSNPLYRGQLKNTQASAVILGPLDAEDCATNVLLSDNPRLDLVHAMKLFQPKKDFPEVGIDPSAIVGIDCQISKTAAIGPLCVIGNRVVIEDGVILEAMTAIGSDCSIGENTRLCARVSLYDQVSIGQNCLIHSGTVVGSDGFGFAQSNGKWVKMPHLGGVWIGNDVEIGANTAIDRGALEDTRIENGVIIDNLVQIAHNVTIGENTAIAACVAIAGSTKIGRQCLIGGGSSIAGHLEIVDNVHITATSAVNRSLTHPGQYSSGFPAKPSAVWRKNVARFHFLDEMARRLRSLEKKINQPGKETENL